MKQKHKKIGFWITIFLGMTFGFWIWLTWQKIHTYLGNSNIVWLISGGVVLIGGILGYFKWETLVDRFS